MGDYGLKWAKYPTFSQIFRWGSEVKFIKFEGKCSFSFADEK